MDIGTTVKFPRFPFRRCLIFDGSRHSSNFYCLIRFRFACKKRSKQSPAETFYYICKVAGVDKLALIAAHLEHRGSNRGLALFSGQCGLVRSASFGFQPANGGTSMREQSTLKRRIEREFFANNYSGFQLRSGGVREAILFVSKAGVVLPYNGWEVAIFYGTPANQNISEELVHSIDTWFYSPNQLTLPIRGMPFIFPVLQSSN